MPNPRAAIGWLSVTLAMASVDAAGPDVRLAQAARAGDRPKVDALLAAGVPVDSTEPDGSSALHWAVYRDDAAMTDRLLAAGANANLPNRNAATPLTLACTNASAAIVQRLLAAEADPNAAPSGAPPLVTCSAAGAENAVRMLLARGADVNAADTFRRQTPLMWAAAENHSAIVKLLIETGATLDARSRGDFTALMFAVRQDAREAARLLIDAGADVNFTAANAQSALRLAINNRHYTLASALLDAGARVDTRDKQGNTPLHLLVTSRSLQRYAANPATVSSEDAAGHIGSLDLMKKLVAWGADPNAPTEAVRVVHEKWTDKGIYSANRPFMDNGVNMGGATPYLLAAQAVDFEAMRLLHALGADPRAVTSAGNTAVMLAAGVGYVEGSRRYRPERDALEAVELAASGGVDVNATNANGQTALHGAVYRAANTIIGYLVRAGARTDVSDELDRTPLKLAEQGFNQVASLIRRDSAAALLRELGAKATSAPSAAPQASDAR
jgi:ankyrin repeat protein